MTAEIAIANKSALALAADSAVSFGDRTSPKIYHTVNKITMLSKYHPVGVMVYGGAEFMGVPVETIAKMYREDKGAKTENTCLDYAIDFVSYAAKGQFARDEEQYRGLASIIYEEMVNIRDRSLRKVQQIFLTKRKYNDLDIRKSIESVIDTNISVLNRYSWVEPKIISKNDLGKKFGRDIDRIAHDVFDNVQLTKKILQKLRENIFLALNKKCFSNGMTGLVIAGFGSDEIFPSLVEVKSDGVLNGKLKADISRAEDIGRQHDQKEVGAFIMPFAQHEMVGRFMSGVDQSYQRYLERYISRLMRGLSEEILNQTVASSSRAAWDNAIKGTVDQMIEKFQDDMKDYRRQNFWQPIVDVVEHLPKEELANLAESLVSLTSMKRRVSNEAETVGGPIDVAVISRGDGFVWIKRKHYFDGDLNPHFFRNYMTRHRKGEV